MKLMNPKIKLGETQASKGLICVWKVAFGPLVQTVTYAGKQCEMHPAIGYWRAGKEVGIRADSHPQSLLLDLLPGEGWRAEFQVWSNLALLVFSSSGWGHYRSKAKGPDTPHACDVHQGPPCREARLPQCLSLSHVQDLSAGTHLRVDFQAEDQGEPIQVGSSWGSFASPDLASCWATERTELRETAWGTGGGGLNTDT